MVDFTSEDLEEIENEVSKEQHRKSEKGFDFSKEEITSKYTIVCFGLKGASKTYTSFGITDNKRDVISFDHKSVMIASNFFKNENINVYDGLRYFVESSDSTKVSAHKSIDYIMELINQFNNPEWIIIDGYERLSFLAQMEMRYIKNIGVYEPVGGGNMSFYWYIRNEVLNKIYNFALGKAKKGVIYTTYIEKEQVIDNGIIIKSKDVPKWQGDLLTQADIVIKTENIFDKNIQKFEAIIESSKTPTIKTGSIYNLTGHKKLREFDEWKL